MELSEEPPAAPVAVSGDADAPYSRESRDQNPMMALMGQDASTPPPAAGTRASDLSEARPGGASVKEYSKQAALLLCAIAVLLFTACIGALVFKSLEADNERLRAEEYRNRTQTLRRHIEAALLNDAEAKQSLRHLIEGMEIYANHKGAAPSVQRPNWTFEGAFFFSFSVMTTIGYGTFAPATPAGRAAVVIFGIFSIIVTATCLHLMAKAFNGVFTLSTHGLDKELRVQTKTKVIMVSMVVYWVGSSIIFSIAEPEWSFFSSFYFTFVSFTTIGLGDLATKRHPFYVIMFVGLGIFAAAIDIGVEWATRRRQRKAKPEADIAADGPYAIGMEDMSGNSANMHKADVALL